MMIFRVKKKRDDAQVLFKRVSRFTKETKKLGSVESSTDSDRRETVFVWEEEKNGLAVINDSIV